MKWENALTIVHNDYVCRNSPIQWGVSDCCQFAAEYAEILTGRDYAADFKYDSERKALKLIAKAGGLVELVRGVLGAPRDGSPVAGDVVALLAEIEPGTEWEALGVFNGDMCFVAGADGDVYRTPELDRITAAWGLT